MFLPFRPVLASFAGFHINSIWRFQSDYTLYFHFHFHLLKIRILAMYLMTNVAV